MRDSSLLALLAQDAVVSDAARSLRRAMLISAGMQPGPEDIITTSEPAAAARRRVGSCRRRSSPGRWPTHSWPPTQGRSARGEFRSGRLAGWELIGPVLTSFEQAAGEGQACMTLPEASWRRAPHGLELMAHQAQLVTAAERGHRASFWPMSQAWARRPRLCWRRRRRTPTRCWLWSRMS